MGEMADYYGYEDPRWIDAELEELNNVQQPFKNDPPLPTKTIWVTREGERIPVRDMTDSHLHNTITMLRRQSPAAVFVPDSPDAYIIASCPTFVAMLAEAQQRGLGL